MRYHLTRRDIQAINQRQANKELLQSIGIMVVGATFFLIGLGVMN